MPDGLDLDEQVRMRELVHRDRRAGRAAGGIRFTLPIDTSITALQLCPAEQDCCPFFEFTLRLDRSRLHLDVEAPERATELLDELVKFVS